MKGQRQRDVSENICGPTFEVLRTSVDDDGDLNITHWLSWLAGLFDYRANVMGTRTRALSVLSYFSKKSAEISKYFVRKADLNEARLF